MTDPERKRIAEETKRACIEAAMSAWEDAGFQGLCGEGRWEAAIGAMRNLDVTTPPVSSPPGSPTLPR